MNKQFTQQETLIKIIRVYLAHYLQRVRTQFNQHLDNIKSFQNQSLNILALYIYQTLKKVIIQAKRIVSMQGRTQINNLHILAAIQQLRLLNFQSFHQYLHAQKRKNYPLQPMLFEKIFRNTFENDPETLNHYDRQPRYSNILHIRPVYNKQFLKNILPFKASIDQAFEFPQQSTYRGTEEEIKRQKQNIQSLKTYTMKQQRRQMGIATIDQNLKKNQQQTQNRVKKKVKSFGVINLL